MRQCTGSVWRPPGQRPRLPLRRRAVAPVAPFRVRLPGAGEELPDPDRRQAGQGERRLRLVLQPPEETGHLVLVLFVPGRSVGSLQGRDLPHTAPWGTAVYLTS